MSEQVCANCGKPYDAHLLWDGNKCHLRSITGWFPKQLADAVEKSSAPFCKCTEAGGCAKVSAKFRCRSDNNVPYATSVRSKAERDYAQMYNALKRICAYQSPDQLRRWAGRDYGLDTDEAIGYAYENIQSEAKAGIKGVRKPVTTPTPQEK